MNKRRELPSVEDLFDLFYYVDGRLFWKERAQSKFKDSRSCRIWNTRYSNKPAGVLTNGEYKITMAGKLWSAHRIIYKMFTGLEPSHVDHIDRTRSNNRIENLREATNTTNAWNSKGHSGTASGLKGVVFHRRCMNRPWKAQISKNGKSYSGGYFSSKEEAYAAACSLRQSLHGEYSSN